MPQSQYAVVPKDSAALLKEEYNVAGPDGSWEVTASNIQWVGLEHEPEFTEAQIDEIRLLNGFIFINPDAFVTWIQQQQ